MTNVSIACLDELFSENKIENKMIKSSAFTWSNGLRSNILW